MIQFNLIKIYVGSYFIFVLLNSFLWFFQLFSTERFFSNYLLILDLPVMIGLVFICIHYRFFLKFDILFCILFPFYFKISFIMAKDFGFHLFNLPFDKLFLSYSFCQVVWFLTIALSLIRLRLQSSGFNVFYPRIFGFTHDSTYLRSLFIPFAFALFSSLFFIYQARDFVFISTRSFSRLEITDAIGQTGWYLKYFIIAYAWIFFLFFLKTKVKNKNKVLVSWFKLVLLFTPILLYVYFQQLAGGRRELVAVLLFALGFFIAMSQGKISFKVYSLVFFAFIAFISFGALRDFGGQNLLKVATDSFGEFLFPISTFQVYFSEDDVSFRAGSTYLYSVTNFIPNSIFPWKPIPLAAEFAIKVAGPNEDLILGYAITPITEAYVNFGYCAILIFPIIMFLLCSLMDVLSNRIIILPIVFFSQTLNFQRSDIASTFFEVSILLFIFYFFYYTSKFRFKCGQYK